MPRWRVRLAPAAERDFADIIDYTAGSLGARQARIYRTTLTHALKTLHAGPNLPGSAVRAEIGQGLRSRHVARGGRRGRHQILYRDMPEQSIEVVRILHDAMDPARRFPAIE